MICVPITSTTTEEALKDIKEAESLADIIELRVDYLYNADLKKLLEHKKKPYIVTVRSKSEGGNFTGSDRDKFFLLQEAVKLKADYIDVEANFSLLTEIDKKDSRLIISYHNFRETPVNLWEIHKNLNSFKPKPDVVKIVTWANSINDNLRIRDFLKKAPKNTISLCMGPYGEISRVLCQAWGSFLTFGSLEAGKESASGQMPIKVLKEIYGVNNVTKKTLVFGALGNPINKSKGYLIHNAAFQKMGLNNVYLSFLADDGADFLKAFAPMVQGLSVTMPFKQDIMPVLDKLDPLAEKIAAVNTVVKKNGQLLGYNTDCSGAIQAIQAETGIKNKKVTLLGAGGAARAVAVGILEEGGRLTILNRTKSKAKKLADEFNCESGGLNEIGDYDILINTTSVGMYPNIYESPVLKEKLLKNKVVFDAVYNPAETRLLKDAKEKNCTVISGIEMFVNQAAEQLKLWTGKNPPIKLMKRVLMESL